MFNSEELIGITEYLTLYTGCRINRYRYNRVRLYFECKICYTIVCLVLYGTCLFVKHAKN
jgi:hypothetical protein